MKIVQIYLNNLSKLAAISNFLAFFCYYLKIFPSWIRIQERKGMRIRFHSPVVFHPPARSLTLQYKSFPALVWCPQGSLLAVHRKIHLFDIGECRYRYLTYE